MFDLSNLVVNLKSLGAAVVETLGDPASAPAYTKAPDGKSWVVFRRPGYVADVVSGPTAAATRHAFEDVGSLAAWLLRRAKPDATDILLDPVKGFVAILDPGDVDSAVVTCPLPYHPRAERWLAILDKPIAHKALLSLIRGAAEDFQTAIGSDNRPVGSYGEILAAELAKFEALKTVEVAVEVNENGVTVLSSATEKTTIRGKIPAKVTVRVPMFVGVTDNFGEISYDLPLFVEVRPAEKGPPSFVLTCPSLPIVHREAQIDASKMLGRLLGDGWLVGLGSAARSTFVPSVR